jgi:hypothetical protein
MPDREMGNGEGRERRFITPCRHVEGKMYFSPSSEYRYEPLV